MDRKESLIAFTFHSMAHEENEGFFPEQCDLSHTYNFDVKPSKLKHICIDIRKKIIIPKIMEKITKEINQIKHMGVILDPKSNFRGISVQYFHPLEGLKQKLIDFVDEDEIFDILERHQILPKVTSFCVENPPIFTNPNGDSAQIINFDCAESTLYKILQEGIDVLPFDYKEKFLQIQLLIKTKKIDVDPVIKNEILTVEEHECFILSNCIPVFLKRFDYLKNLKVDALESFFGDDKSIVFLSFIDDFRTLLINKEFFEKVENLAILYLAEFFKLKSLARACHEAVYISSRTNSYLNLQLMIESIGQFTHFYVIIENGCEEYINRYAILKKFFWICSDDINSDIIHYCYHKFNKYTSCVDCHLLYDEINFVRNFLQNFHINTKLTEKWVVIFEHLKNSDCTSNKLLEMVQYLFSIPGSYVKSSFQKICSKVTLAKTWTAEEEEVKSYLKVMVNADSSCLEFYKFFQNEDCSKLLDKILFQRALKDESVLDD